MAYYDFVKEYMGVDECLNNKKYSNAGHAFCWNKDKVEGIYWFYEGENFIIDIHDFYIKREVVNDNVYSMANYVSIYTTYLISANGENFSPYQTLTANSLYTLDFDNVSNNFRFLLHANSCYLGVAIGFKREVLEKHFASMHIDSNSFYDALFSENQTILTQALKPIAMEILNCKMESPAAEFFFKAKANEWISLVIDAYLKRKQIKISQDDDQALMNVAKYLDDHFAMNVSQETLEKISMMSGTKLKKLFKEKYQQNITEYTQRKRMNMAEVLLFNTNLTIKEIAESVGYSSHSKFTSYYKRYKGQAPSDIRKFSNMQSQNCNKCNKEKLRLYALEGSPKKSLKI